jgi:glyoxylase-like metal-dependent hydrolase (beta-lactamase superfamily II)
VPRHVQEIAANLFRIRIPLPGMPIGYLNSYVIRSRERSLIIDTGLNREECLKAMQAGLKSIGIKAQDADFFITHFHADHALLLHDLATSTTKVFCSRSEGGLLKTYEGTESMLEFCLRHGFPDGEMDSVRKTLPISHHARGGNFEVCAAEDGQKFDYGDYSFTCVETPGHSMGHMCLYEAENKILVSGDHILKDISPNIQCWSEGINPLQSYFASLHKVCDLEVTLVLPGHRHPFSGHRRRIRELMSYHGARLSEILNIIGKGLKTAYEIAAKMNWDFGGGHWRKFPALQKLFATSEVIAQLRNLEDEGHILRKTNVGTIQYCRTFSTVNSQEVKS